MKQIHQFLTSAFALVVGLLCLTVSASAEVRQGTAVVKALNGPASYVDELGVTHPLEAGTVLKEGQTIKTGRDASVDLYLAQNGPAVGLDGNTVLRLQKLSNEPGPLGTIIDTRLDLQQGRVSGIVEKLLPGSRYEIKTPQGLATVRGTEFFIDASNGTIYVVGGTVTLTVTLNVDIKGGGTIQETKVVTINAGQYLWVPSNMTVKTFSSLKPVKSPYSLADLERLKKLGKVKEYGNGKNSGTSTVTETFNAQQTGKSLKLQMPPTTITVSP